MRLRREPRRAFARLTASGKVALAACWAHGALDRVVVELDATVIKEAAERRLARQA